MATWSLAPNCRLLALPLDDLVPAPARTPAFWARDYVPSPPVEPAQASTSVLGRA